VALLQLAGRVRGGRILDVGIGTGRTTSLLRLLSDDYIGVDYVASMVATARDRHPGVDISVGDARELKGVADDSVDLAVFSYNGIDAVDHEDRQRVLASFKRTLRPGGYLLYSTFNADGPVARERPWRVNAPMPWQVGSLQPSITTPSRRAAALLREIVRHPSDRPRSIRSWMQLRGHAIRGDGWQVAPIGAHRFGLLVHLTRLPEVRREVAAHGFELVDILGSDRGDPLTADTSTDWWFHVIARKPLDPAGSG
jgi:ubiquinone/menaquinone biosynthesis C-methylase UbiE